MKSTKEYGFKEIKTLMPYEYPFLFIDRAVLVEPNEKIICKKNVTGNEYFFVGHFKDNPVMPGVILIETMAQAAYLLGRLSSFEEKSFGKREFFKYYFARIRDLRFFKPVHPGDQISIEVQMITRLKASHLVEAKAFVAKELVCKGELMFVKG